MRNFNEKKRFLGLNDASDKLPLFAWGKDIEELKVDPIVNAWFESKRRPVGIAMDSQAPPLWFKPKKEGRPLLDQMSQAEQQISLQYLRGYQLLPFPALQRAAEKEVTQEHNCKFDLLPFFLRAV